VSKKKAKKQMDDQTMIEVTLYSYPYCMSKKAEFFCLTRSVLNEKAEKHERTDSAAERRHHRSLGHLGGPRRHDPARGRRVLM
jgi:hypothetical protein